MRARVTAPVALIAVGLLIAACGSSGSTKTSASSGGGSAGAPATAASGTPAADRSLTIATASGSGASHLVGANGRTVYLWEADRSGRSSCSGACANAWPPVLAKSMPKAGGSVKMSKLATIRRAGGVKQVTYNGHPLYYFAGDTSKGQTNGQGSDGFGAKWWLVSAAGSAITTGESSSGSSGSGSGSPATSTSSSSSSGGGWG
jgi:predicted lipoprotein with Yx(FWY)xxD motif